MEHKRKENKSALMSPLVLASLNIQTLNNIERQESLVEELNYNDVHIACLQETRRAGEHYLDLENYRVFYKGETNTKYGVGIAIKNTMLDIIRSGPMLTERIYHLIMRIKDEINVHIINVYAPHNNLPAIEKNTFYKKLSDIILGIPESETVFIIGDFNAHVGRDRSKWPNIIGDYGYGKTNNNGNRLLRFCDSYNFVITNTQFDLEEDLKHTFQSPDGKKKTQIDLCLTRQRDLQCIIRCDPFIHRIHRLGHKMLIVEIKQNKIKTSIPCIEKTKESSRSDKLFLEAKDHILQLDKKGETEEFKDAWESFRLSFKNHLGKIVDKNEDTIWFRLRHVEEVREFLGKKSLSDQKSTELYDTPISALSKCLCLIDDGSRNEDNDNVSIFNDNFTDEINESADVTCNFREIS
ncbi:craniofacial development protein 2-like [Biomphalaria glabrata]|uniref:Craniofacial development protein 2-like n=1 Tax=Biomphalaria glabrata TaxID=6526 RepID=A0A9W2ZDD1_BIOGL|nr:craniofacial development protein 2-like [Biomphalaria glabrata]